MSKTGYLAPEGLEGALARELREVVLHRGRFFVAKGAPQKVRFVQNIWYDVQEIPFRTIGEAAAILRNLHGLWAWYPLCINQYRAVCDRRFLDTSSGYRRGELIAKRLPFFKPKPLAFPASSLPTASPGSWTLLDDQTLLCSSVCSSPFAHGEIHFAETKEPPSRAYLKLWEFFTRTGIMPQKGERCLEIGASPGGWTWALNALGVDVTAVDRAPLAPTVQCSRFVKKDAFSLSPDHFGDVEWIFSDVVCYPEKLLAWILPWLKKGRQFVCTLKFQGIENESLLRKFEEIGELVHLFHNKHELTWYRTGPKSGYTETT